MKRKDTHTLQQVETYCYELVTRIQEAETIEEKKALLKKLKRSEQFCNDINTKETNGKQYPARMYHSDTKPMNKEEIFKLIDSVPDELHRNWVGLDTIDYTSDKDLAGVFVTKD